MGYGAAFIGKYPKFSSLDLTILVYYQLISLFSDTENRLLYYHVLWLPTRFGHLFSYIAAILIILILIIFGVFICILYRVRRLLRCIYSKTVAYRFYSLP